MLKAALWFVAVTAMVPLLAQSADAPPLAARVGDYVERYYSRAQRVLVRETVVMQPLRWDMSPDGFARRLEYEMRVEWNPAAAEEPATVVRELISERGPKLGPPEKPDCLDPRGVSPEPLAFLLPQRQEKMRFRTAGVGKVGERHSLMLEYRPVRPEPPIVEWDDECGHVELPGRLRGRVWADPESAEVLKMTEGLVGPVDIPGPPAGRRRRTSGPLSFTIERADTTIEYQEVRFDNPEERLMLPSEVVSVSVILRSGLPRIRVTQRYTNYRRFLTDSKIILPE